jgi:hypothetical protein
MFRYAVVPRQGTVTPATAIQRIAGRNDRRPADSDLIEINEAYAATPLVSTLVLADGDRKRVEKIRERTNVHGGAVAIGHPLGASGARILMTLINGLRRRVGEVRGSIGGITRPTLLAVLAGRHLLAAKLRPASLDAAAGAVAEVARIVARIRGRWPKVRIMLRADSGFAREELMGLVRGQRGAVPIRIAAE